MVHRDTEVRPKSRMVLVCKSKVAKVVRRREVLDGGRVGVDKL